MSLSSTAAGPFATLFMAVSVYRSPVQQVLAVAQTVGAPAWARLCPRLLALAASWRRLRFVLGHALVRLDSVSAALAVCSPTLRIVYFVAPQTFGGAICLEAAETTTITRIR